MNEFNECNFTQSDENFKGEKMSDDLDKEVEANVVSEQDSTQQNTRPNVPEELLKILKKDEEHTFEQCLQQFEIERLIEIANYLKIPRSDNYKQMIKQLQQFEQTKFQRTTTNSKKNPL